MGGRATGEQGLSNQLAMPTSGIALVGFQAAKSLVLQFQLSVEVSLAPPAPDTSEVPGSESLLSLGGSEG